MPPKKEKEASVSLLELQMQYIEKSVEDIKKSQEEARKERIASDEKIFQKLDNLWNTFVSRAEYDTQKSRIMELETHQKIQDEKLQGLGIRFATWGGALGVVIFVIGKIWN